MQAALVEVRMAGAMCRTKRLDNSQLTGFGIIKTLVAIAADLDIKPSQ